MAFLFVISSEVPKESIFSDYADNVSGTIDGGCSYTNEILGRLRSSTKFISPMLVNDLYTPCCRAAVACTLTGFPFRATGDLSGIRTRDNMLHAAGDLRKEETKPW